jgi:hypothetical protein
MSKLLKIYRRNIYGIIGTLVFHILLVSVFLLAEVKRSVIVNEEAIILDFTFEELEVPEEKEVMPPEEESNQPSETPNQPRELGSNIPVNEAAKPPKDDFFDEDYLRELEAAKNLVNDVSKTLSAEIPEIGDVEMPEETTEGMKPEEIKNIIYKGKSNISYFLENRYHRSIPIPIYLAEGGGNVVVDIVVDQRGTVLNANPRNNPSVKDRYLFAYAKQAALKSRFNIDFDAPEKQRGTITYNFVPQ